MHGDDHDGSLVVVPHEPGRLVRPAAGRARPHDTLDGVIDDLFPETEGGPTWFDGVLLAGGAGLLIWALATGGPTAAIVIAVILLSIGCLLPLRSILRAVVRRRQAAALGRGQPLRVADGPTARLVAAYESLLGVEGVGTPAVAAAHAAVLEAATLLRGRDVSSDRERAYVDERADAIERLVAALAAPRPTFALEASTDDVLDARQELDLLSGVNALARLNELTLETRGGSGGTG